MDEIDRVAPNSFFEIFAPSNFFSRRLKNCASNEWRNEGISERTNERIRHHPNSAPQMRVRESRFLRAKWNGNPPSSYIPANRELALPKTFPITNFVFNRLRCCTKVPPINPKYFNLFEISQNGAFNRGLFTKFLYSKLAWSPISCSR